MTGYLDDPDITRTVMSSAGWYTTGDLGLMTEDGSSLEIKGRTKYIISKGGIKVYHQVIEDMLLMYGKISQVCVIGVPDAKLFNEICACIIPKPNEHLSESELFEYCKQKALGNMSLMIPKFNYFTDTFPLNCNGKTDKKRLIQLTTEYFHLKNHE